MRLSEVFGSIFVKPSNFPADPYGHLTNQLGHGWLGNLLTTFTVAAVYWATGEYPNQFVAAFSVISAYFFFWELNTQGWRGVDSIEDALFVAYGAGLYFVIEMDEVIWRLFLWHTVALVVLLPGTYCRILQKVRRDNETLD